MEGPRIVAKYSVTRAMIRMDGGSADVMTQAATTNPNH